MNPLARRIAIGLFGGVCLVEGGATLYLKTNETNLVFQPQIMGGRTVRPIPDSLHLPVTPLKLTSTDGAALTGIEIAPSDSTAQWLLYLHGNGGNITSAGLPEFYRRWHALGLGIATIDYRGYGESESRTPSEAGLYADARALYDHLRARGIPAQRIVIYGHSLGTGVATELATRVEAAGLILEGGFTSVPDRGAELYPYVPVKLIASQRFANIEKIGRVAMPKLLMHASDDAVIPFAHGQRLFAAAQAPKEFVELKGGHMDAFRVDSANFWGHVAAFAQRLRSDLPAAESPPPARP